MDLLEINKLINKSIQESENLCDQLDDLAEKRAIAQASYERRLATVMHGLKCGMVFELDGQEISNPPVSTTEKIAKGICWMQSNDALLADSMFKNLNKKIDLCRSNVSALQTLIKFFDHKVS